jgi:hypothetical protein
MPLGLLLDLTDRDRPVSKHGGQEIDRVGLGRLLLVSVGAQRPRRPAMSRCSSLLCQPLRRLRHVVLGVQEQHPALVGLGPRSLRRRPPVVMAAMMAQESVLLPMPGSPPTHVCLPRAIGPSHRYSISRGLISDARRETRHPIPWRQRPRRPVPGCVWALKTRGRAARIRSCQLKTAL